ncbi:hypothetical protein EVA_10771 [gut metagenome]|uniref:Uncharacterized protein n=1 Tax=gut metagenome TaxID=749906 RepID=J9G1P7_9ZZZZ
MSITFFCSWVHDTPMVLLLPFFFYFFPNLIGIIMLQSSISITR